MRAGQLRTRLEIQKATSVRRGAGSLNKTWETEATVWARVEPLSGRELFTAQQIDSDVTHRVTMRSREAPVTKTTHRFRFKHAQTRLLNIVSVVNPDQRGRQLVAVCKEST